jgi:S-adenosylmethionine:tRNA ribosyltransferase-isomerase
MNLDLFSLFAYDYELPSELIAQKPAEPRDSSRLLIVDRASGQFSEIVFRDLPTVLTNGDSLIFNDTKVIPARLFGHKESGGKAEIFLVKQLADGHWEALAKPGRRLAAGSKVIFGPDFSCTILDTLPDGSKIIQLNVEGELFALLDKYGKVPLPVYIKRDASEGDVERYQTVYAQERGSVAAPTAGLHFTRDLLSRLSAIGVDRTTLTLHVGLGTFQPVSAEDIRQHRMHTELCTITEQAAKTLNSRSKSHKQIVVGTTTCRTLETAATEEGKIQSGTYSTDIFIYPGYRFKYVQALLTNFHLPRSSLLMLVSAFAGYDLIREAYRYAIAQRFRFYSYGDAMLIL